MRAVRRQESCRAEAASSPGHSSTGCSPIWAASYSPQPELSEWLSSVPMGEHAPATHLSGGPHNRARGSEGADSAATWDRLGRPRRRDAGARGRVLLARLRGATQGAHQCAMVRQRRAVPPCDAPHRADLAPLCRLRHGTCAAWPQAEPPATQCMRTRRGRPLARGASARIGRAAAATVRLRGGLRCQPRVRHVCAFYILKCSVRSIHKRQTFTTTQPSRS